MIRLVSLALAATALLTVLTAWRRGFVADQGKGAAVRPEGPATAEEWLRQGDLDLRSRRLGRAEAAFREALTLDARLAPARLGLAWIHSLKMRRREAVSEYAAASGLRPLDAGQVLVWTEVRRGMWDLDKVTGPLRECLAEEPDDPWIRVALAEGLRQAGKPSEAAEMLAPLGETVPEAAIVRARLALDGHDAQAAEKLLRAAPPDHPGRAELEGKIALARRDPGVAISRFRSALAADPDQRTALLGLAQALRMAEQPDSLPGILETLRAMDRLDYLVRQASESRLGGRIGGPLLRDLGMACESLGYRDEARAWFRLAIAADPLDSQAQAALFRLSEARTAQDPGPDEKL